MTTRRAVDGRSRTASSAAPAKSSWRGSGIRSKPAAAQDLGRHAHEQDPRLRPQPAAVLLGEVERRGSGGDHGVERHAAVLLGQQGDELGLDQLLRIAQHVERLGEDIHRVPARRRQRRAHGAIERDESRKRGIRIVQDHHAPRALRRSLGDCKVRLGGEQHRREPPGKPGHQSLKLAPLMA
jgi:hypothetical protein